MSAVPSWLWIVFTVAASGAQTARNAMQRDLIATLGTAGATFVREDETDACYRIWSIGDRHPAMQRVGSDGVRVALELWAVPLAGLASILQNEPPGLAIGKVVLRDGSVVLGVLSEPWLCQGQREITSFGGWRAYTAAQQ